MALTVSLLWRGPLASCNFACAYCPFAKRRDSRRALEADRAALRRFVDWIATQPAEDRLSLMFIPWGEALIRRHYREALLRLSHLPQVETVAVQTNLSAPMGWVADADAGRLAFWCTWHPGQMELSRFVERCATLRRHGVGFSAGVVGVPEHRPAVAALRAALPPEVYVWVNALAVHPYTAAEIDAFTAADPLFELSLHRPWPSRDQPCGAGERSIAVDGEGTVRRCPFLAEPLGNLYRDDLSGLLRPRPCPAESCRCHIGYVQLESLRLEAVFGRGLLPRIPAQSPTRAMAQQRLARRDQVSATG